MVCLNTLISIASGGIHTDTQSTQHVATELNSTFPAMELITVHPINHTTAKYDSKVMPNTQPTSGNMCTRSSMMLPAMVALSGSACTWIAATGGPRACALLCVNPQQATTAQSSVASLRLSRSHSESGCLCLQHKHSHDMAHQHGDSTRGAPCLS